MGCDFSQASHPQNPPQKKKFKQVFIVKPNLKGKRPACIIPFHLSDEDANLLLQILSEDQAYLLAEEMEKNSIPLNIQVSEPGMFWSLAHMCCKYDAVLCLQYILNRVYFETDIYIDFVNAQTAEGYTCLHIAAQQGSIDCLNLLLNYGGVNLQLKTNQKATAFSLAKMAKNDQTASKLYDYNSCGVSFLKLAHSEFNQNAYTKIYDEEVKDGKRRLKEKYGEKKNIVQQQINHRMNEMKRIEKQLQDQYREKLRKEEEQLQRKREQFQKEQKRRDQQSKAKMEEQKRIAQQKMEEQRKKAQQQMEKAEQQENKRKIQQELLMRQLQAAEQLRIQQQQERKRIELEQQRLRKQLIEQQKRKQMEMIQQRKKMEEEKNRKEKQEADRRRKQQQQLMLKLKRQQQEERKRQKQENVSIIQQQRKMLEKEMEAEKKRLAQQSNQIKVINYDNKNTVVGVCPPQYQNLYNSIGNGQFTDESFPPQLSTIGENPTAQMKDSIWLRPGEIFGQYFVFDNVNPQDIKQGALGVCYYLATLSSLAENPDRITSLFTFYDMKKGFYVLKFYDMGVQKYVVVDDLFPCYKRSKQPLFTNTRSKQIWVMILQKAWVKQFGNYLKAEAMSPDAMMSNISGAPSKGLWIKDKPVNQTFSQLLAYDKEGYIIVLTSRSAGAPQGIVACHAYSLISVHEYKNQKLYKIRNPWGSFEWKGLFSDNSNKWTNQLKQALNHTPDENDGTFIMTYTQLNQGFEYVSIGLIKKKYEVGTAVQIQAQKGQDKFYKFQVNTPGLINVRVFQPFNRFIKDSNYKYSALVFQLVGIDKKQFISEGSNTTHFGGKAVDWDDNIYANLQKGRYLIRLKFDWVNPSKYKKSSIGSYAPQKITFQQVSEEQGWRLWEEGFVGTYQKKNTNSIGNGIGYLFEWKKAEAIIYVKGPTPTNGIRFTFTASSLQNCQLGRRKISKTELQIRHNQIGTLDKIHTKDGTSAGSFTMNILK